MDELRELLDVIEQFEEGDLLAAADIRERAENLQGEVEEEELKTLLAEITELFEEFILQGAQKGQEERLEKVRKELAASLGEEASEESGAAKEPEADGETETPEDAAPDIHLDEAPEGGGEAAAEEQGGAADAGQAQAGPEAGSLVHVEDTEILFSFLLEAKDHLDDIEGRILELEQEYDNQLVHDIFRSMHTIKGVSSFIGVEHVKVLSHKLETILNSMRNEELELDDEIIDILLAGSDALTKLVYDLDEQAQQFEKGKPADVYDGRIDTSELYERMKPYLDSVEGGKEDAVASAQTKEDKPKQDAGQTPQAQEPQAQTVPPPDSGYEDLISPEMVQKFVEESSDLIDTAENSMLELEKNPNAKDSVEEAFRAIHTVKGNAGFFGYGGLEKMCMGIEGVLDALRKGNREADANVVSLLLESLDGLSSTLQKIQKGEIGPSMAEETSVSASEAIESKDQGDYKPLGDMLVEMGVASRDAVDQALDMQRMKLGEILVNTGAAKEEEVNKVLQKQSKGAEKGDQFAGYRMKRKDIRVDTERLDTLFDLMGELITAEAMVINSPELEEYDLPGFERAAGYLSKISREMQELTMSIRMIPLEGLFSKMRRLVRDLSKKFDKPVNLLISGEGTEMDRNVMEEISDPLVHIIRNSLDHGIEDQETRQKNGKSGEGTVELSAGYEGNEIWITITDDGGGLKRDKLIEKASERGVISGNPEEMSDDEVWKLIFEPGFSTAEKVSEISGRGVGMDVVKKNIEKLRGKIDVRSEEGKGSTFVLRIPLTLAIIDAINFIVGPQLYSIPITDILRFYKATRKEITRTEADREVINLRSEVIPIVKLHDFFKVDTNKREVEEGIVVVVQARDRKMAILVDEIVGYRQVVIKALPRTMNNIRAISGCSIMADGKVSLIVDTNALLGYVLE
jgi:two-component system, chemotaxis family, sensor kinase CheA